MKLNEIVQQGKSVADLGIEYIGGNFNCYRNNLTSLEGAPKEVSGDFACFDNILTSLEGAPKEVDGDFYCGSNPINDFKDIHKQIKRINGSFIFANCPIKSHVLGLLLIEGVTKFVCDNDLLEDILNSALAEFPNEPKRRVLYAQKRLLEEHQNGKELAKV